MSLSSYGHNQFYNLQFRNDIRYYVAITKSLLNSKLLYRGVETVVIMDNSSKFLTIYLTTTALYIVRYMLRVTCLLFRVAASIAV